MGRLLTAVSAPQADEVGKMKMELRRLIFDEQVRGEKRKAGGSLIDGLPHPLPGYTTWHHAHGPTIHAAWQVGRSA